MKKLERRIRELVHSRPGIKTSEIIEYFGQDPSKIDRTLNEMKRRGAIVGKPIGVVEETEQ